MLKWRLGMEDWEKPLAAAAIYFVDPRPEEEAMRDMQRLVGKEEAERIAALVWRVVYGEGYTYDSWGELLENLTLLSPWECIWRFQELTSKHLRKKHKPPPKTINDQEALRAACKTLGAG